MPVEVIAAILTAFGAFVGLYVSYMEPAGFRKKVAIGLSVVLVLAALLCTIEVYKRSEYNQGLALTLERDWTLFREREIVGVTFEVMFPDGVLALSDIMSITNKVHIDVANPSNLNGLKLLSGRTFSDYLNVDNIAKYGNIGVARMSIETDRFDPNRKIKHASLLSCTMSEFSTAQILTKQANGGSPLACAITGKIAIAGEPFKIGSLENSPFLRLSLDKMDKYHCTGECKGLILSVRLMMRQYEAFNDSMMEISPQLYLKDKPTSMSENRVIFELSGHALLEIAKSNYLESHAYRDRASFAFTKGYIAEWVEKLLFVESNISTTILGEVLTTDSSPSIEELRSMIEPRESAQSDALAYGEWCGFVSSTLCWHRYIMIKETP